MNNKKTIITITNTKFKLKGRRWKVEDAENLLFSYTHQRIYTFTIIIYELRVTIKKQQ